MSWMQRLYETYEARADAIGRMEERRVPLLPIYHITQQAQLEAVIDLEGNWCRGRGRILADKAERTTIIPVTEKSAARTSAPEPHPLFDKLQYMAGDYAQHGPQKRYAYPRYLEELRRWCASEFAHPSVRAIERYLAKGTLIRDLADERLLYREADGRVPEKWAGPRGDTPPIFGASPNQLDAFVRFRVLGAPEERVWLDPGVHQSWVDYVNASAGELDCCYALGRLMPVSELSPKNIRRPGDGAKLISSNDNQGFTFRGRFETPREAACVGRETTEKAHSALRWLISRQGYHNDTQELLAWSVKKQLPARVLGQDTLGLAAGYEHPEADPFADMEAFDTPLTSTMEEFAERFRRAAAGYGKALQDGDDAAVIGLDSATPGRLSIFYYREMQARDLFERINRWHETCSWLHRYRFMKCGVDGKGKDKQVAVPFVGAPAPIDIAKAAYGPNVDEKLQKSTLQRLLPCIVDGARLPQDIMLCAVRRATGAAALEPYDAGKTTSIACALARKYYNQKEEKTEEVWTLALDKGQDNRSYLFGRALAYARRLEELAQWAAGNEARQTNAQRLQVAFAQHPAHTWEVLYRHLSPYLARLGSHTRYETELNEVVSRIKFNDYMTDKPLEPVYLLGYQSQLHQFDTEKKNVEQKNGKED